MNKLFIIGCMLLASSGAVAEDGRSLSRSEAPQYWLDSDHSQEPQYAEPNLVINSASALIVDQRSGETLYSKQSAAIMPIASITKLMTAMVVIDADQPLDELLTISNEDLDYLKGTGSRLPVGTRLTRRELLHLALMSSENRAASALARYYPGGKYAAVDAMNEKAQQLRMYKTRFQDPTGLHRGNVSTAESLVKMVKASYRYPLIRELTTATSHQIYTNYGKPLAYKNSNQLVRDGVWNIGLSKTGYIAEAGRCLVMQATVAEQPVIIVLLDSIDTSARVSDANRIKRWLENSRKTFGRPSYSS